MTIICSIAEFVGVKFPTINQADVLYVLLGFLMDILVIKLLVYVAHLCEVEFDKIEMAIISAFLLAIFIGCYYSVATREYAYYWDEVREYAGSFAVEDMLNQEKGQGILALIHAIRSQQRGPLINLFMAVPFLFTSKTPDAWVLSIYFNIFPALGIVVGIFIKSIQKRIEIMNKHYIFAMGYGLLFLMPLVYRPYLYGFPDVYGVVFCLIILLCLWHTDFEKREIGQWIVLSILMLTLALLRDQYIVWIISAYICFFGVYLCNLLFQKKFQKVKKCVVNILIVGGVYM